MTTWDSLLPEAEDIIRRCTDGQTMIATAESCTGGLIAALLTEIAGSSAVVDRGFVTYSNEAKEEMLGVKPATLANFGAVSQETAREMADGALARSRAKVAISVTGIAGPSGGSADKPVGTVHFGIAANGLKTQSVRMQFGDLGRSQIRLLTVKKAFQLISNAIDSRT